MLWPLLGYFRSIQYQLASSLTFLTQSCFQRVSECTWFNALWHCAQIHLFGERIEDLLDFPAVGDPEWNTSWCPWSRDSLKSKKIQGDAQMHLGPELIECAPEVSHGMWTDRFSHKFTFKLCHKHNNQTKEIDMIWYILCVYSLARYVRKSTRRVVMLGCPWAKIRKSWKRGKLKNVISVSN